MGKKHCGSCLVRTVTDEDGNRHKDYYHKVLEAKIIFSDSIVISPGTEFIEDEGKDVEKQDCENAAAKHLPERIKKQYLFNLKEWTHKIITKDYKDLDADLGHTMENLCAEKGIGAFYNGVKKITGKTEEDRPKQICFRWVTNIKITERNLEELILAAAGAGRSRMRGSITRRTESISRTSEPMSFT